MTISENWMLNEIYSSVKEILQRLEKLENGKTEETETQRDTDNNSDS